MAKRIFIYEGKEYEDSDEGMTPDDVRKMYSEFFPELNNAEVIKGKKGDDETFTFKKRVGTKGAVRSPAGTQRDCDEWNSKYPIGTKVIVTLDLGEKVHSVTQSKAEILEGHTAVIWLAGIRGCYLLSRVEAVNAH